jgi:hypothetical protein
MLLNSLPRPRFFLLALLTFLVAIPVWAGVGGSISGNVKDPAGNVIPNASVGVKDVNTGRLYQTQSDSSGHFTLPVLPVGTYQMTVVAPGFGSYVRKDITLNDNGALTFDVPLAVGSVADTVSVSDYSIHVETTNSQMGEVVSGRQIEAMPLNGRSFTDLLSLQPGVAPMTSITATTVQDVGATQLAPSGTLNPGTISVNGQPEGSNIFIVNGSNAEEDVTSGAAVIPIIDSIAEFRIITNNFDAQYGQFSGGQINVVTKSGTNAFHGNVFEFFRNTDLDAKNYFSSGRGAFEQNQYGGTFGGPIRRDKVFFFADYQHTGQTQGVDSGKIGVPSNADRAGDLADEASSFATVQNFNGANYVVPNTVSGPYLASKVLTRGLGYRVSAGEPYYYTAGEANPNDPSYAPFPTNCTLSSQCVFPNAVIPQGVWSLPAQKLLQYIPAPNNADGTFSTSAYNQLVTDNKGAIRLDANTRLGLLSAYYYIDDFFVNVPYPVSQSGASVPGFNALNEGRAQLIALSDTKILSPSMVNEIHLTLVRDSNDDGQPVGGTNVSLISQGFVNSSGGSSIVALDPKGQSVENVNFNTYSIGAAANQLTQANNSYGISETFTKVLRGHSIKTGMASYIDQVNVHAIAQFNGTFTMNGTETGYDFADFLIGVPTQYNQSQLNPFYARNTYVGAFAQDSWSTKHHLTLNYGVRWDLIEPWTEKYNQISSFVPGEQSVVFPTAPAGIVFPGDPGIARGLAPVHKLDFSPRFGFVWTPQSSNGFFSKLLGGPGNTSIRAGFGTFYTSIEAVSISVLAANPPYGTTYTSSEPPLFGNPFIGAADGATAGQPFPYQFANEHTSASNPDTNLNWTFNPISGIPGFDIRNRAPFTQEYMLSIERQAGRNTILSASYVGTSSHRLEVLIENNPGNPALCLSLSQVNEVARGTLQCGPNGEDSQYISATGQVYNGTRGPLSSNFGSNALQSGIGRASYNALELLARHTSGPLDLIAAYTWGKSMDQSSDIGEEVYPFDPNRSHAISSFSIKNNFVMSYNYRLPFAQFLHPNVFTKGWSLSGITHVSSGFPVTMANPGDNSLIGTNPNGVNNDSIDEPDYTGGSLKLNKNPRTKGNNYFNTADFPLNALGTPGTSKRRFFYGPGTINFDTALSKTVPLLHEKSLYFRIEAFNVFNHASFFGPSAVDGNIGDTTTFGTVVAAGAARIMQAAAKFAF